MKSIKNIIEGLLDANFDIPDFDTDLIDAVTPLGDSYGVWQKLVDEVNNNLAILPYYDRINKMIDSAGEVAAGLNAIKWQPTSLKRITQWANEGTKLPKLDILSIVDNDKVKIARCLNNWLEKANKMPDFKKMIESFDVFYTGSTLGRPSKNGRVYGYHLWTLAAPNTEDQMNLEKLVEKLNKLDKIVVVSWSMNGEGDAILQAELRQIPR